MKFCQAAMQEISRNVARASPWFSPRRESQLESLPLSTGGRVKPSRLVVPWAAAISLSSLAVLPVCISVAAAGPELPAAPQPRAVTAVSLPGAPAEGVLLDYLAIDRPRHRVWVPAGGTGNVDVIDTQTQEVKAVEKFATAEVERRGQKRKVGPSSASVGDGFVYVGNRADSSVCAIDATTLARGGCVTIPSSPDGVVYLAGTHEVWVTTPRDSSIVILDVSAPATPKVAGSFKLDGQPEGYAVDEAHGVFYTNLEDKDRTLRIDSRTRKVTATWMPACGEDGPKGLAVEPAEQLLVVACSDHVEVLEAGKDGKVLSKLDTGAGVDNIDYVSSRRSVYAAAARAAKITVAHLDAKGELKETESQATASGARNAVATEDGVAYVADGPEGKILVARTGVR
jgi:DNA-binding beta-propeller fold protein YncE